MTPEQANLLDSLLEGLPRSIAGQIVGTLNRHDPSTAQVIALAVALAVGAPVGVSEIESTLGLAPDEPHIDSTAADALNAAAE